MDFHRPGHLWCSPSVSVLGAVHRRDCEHLREFLKNQRYHDKADMARALSLAAEKGYEDCAEILLTAGALPDIHDASGVTALITAAKRGHHNIIKLLLRANCRIDKATFHIRATALHWAATNGNEESVGLLLDAGANPDATTIHGRTPLMLAARSDEVEVVQMILGYGVDIDAKDFEGATALHLAVEEDAEESTKLLIDAGAEINATRKNGDTPLILAASKGNIEIMQLLMAEPTLQRDKKGHNLTVLHWAAIGGSPECVKLLTSIGMDPDVKTSDGYFGGNLIVYGQVTPLMLAAERGHIEVVKTLLQLGAEINAVDDEGNTPLTYAINKHHFQCLEVLLDNGADPDGGFISNGMQKERGISPLFQCIKRNNSAIIKRLLKANCDVTVMGYLKGETYLTPLEYAFTMHRFLIARMLIAAGADINKMASDLIDEPLAAALSKDEAEFEKLAMLFRTPPSLFQLTRLCLRKCGKRPMVDWIAKLPLPTMLKNYLDLHDLDDL